ncbi:MAG TPA: MFS transporter [Baekduia sp.]|uniref:MFS transporter n=1 Tax=Baekduia sp. TaxID=2600305 RepID=UPI002D7682FA|nr:MFS transporter [Baekduia sp.]HET6510356.1 MFS transporter [Baekduia sp.]
MAVAHAAAPSRPTARAWTIWAIGAAFYFVAVFHRMALGVAGLTAEQRLHIGHGQLATFTALQFFMYLVMQVPAGLAADRVGPRRTLAAGLACMAAGEALFAAAHALPLALVARALIGMGDALTLLNVLRLAQAWFPPRMGSLLATATGAVGALGQLLGTIPLRAALDAFGWTATFAASSVATILLFFVALATIRDRPDDQAAPARHAHAPVLATLRDAWSRPGTRHGFWVHMALFCPFLTIGALWGSPFLQEGQHLSASAAATYLLVLTAAFAASGPVVGAIAGRGVRAQNRTVLVLNLAVALPWLAILAWPGGMVPHALLLAGFVLCGMATSGGMVAFDIGRRENPPVAGGSATALVNCGGFSSAILCLLVAGAILGDGHGETAARFQVALAPMVALSLLGLVQSARLTRAREAAI